MPEIKGIIVPFIPIGGIEKKRKSKKIDELKSGNSIFDKLLLSEMQKVNLSPGAEALVDAEELTITQEDTIKINRAFELGKENESKKILAVIGENAFTLDVEKESLEAATKWQDGEKFIGGVDSIIFFDNE